MSADANILEGMGGLFRGLLRKIGLKWQPPKTPSETTADGEKIWVSPFLILPASAVLRPLVKPRRRSPGVRLSTCKFGSGSRVSHCSGGAD
jgi:hypothetical protein